MGLKSGRNGAPAPQSRVSLSELQPEEQFYLLELCAEFLAGCSPDAHLDLSALSVFPRSIVSAQRELQKNFVQRDRDGVTQRGRLCRRLRN